MSIITSGLALGRGSLANELDGTAGTQKGNRNIAVTIAN